MKKKSRTLFDITLKMKIFIIQPLKQNMKNVAMKIVIAKNRYLVIHFIEIPSRLEKAIRLNRISLTLHIYSSILFFLFYAISDNKKKKNPHQFDPMGIFYRYHFLKQYQKTFFQKSKQQKIVQY